MLYTTKTCPNCPSAKAHLERAGVEYKVVDANENPDLCAKYNIQSVPTFVKDTESGVEILRGVSEIVGWIRNRA